MKLTYTQILELVEDQKVGNGYLTYPIQLAAKKLREQGYSGKLEIVDETNYDGDGISDMILPSIFNSANNANAKYLQKGKDYACWYPIAEK